LECLVIHSFEFSDPPEGTDLSFVLRRCHGNVGADRADRATISVLAAQVPDTVEVTSGVTMEPIQPPSSTTTTTTSAGGESIYGSELEQDQTLTKIALLQCNFAIVHLKKPNPHKHCIIQRCDRCVARDCHCRFVVMVTQWTSLN